MRRVLAIGFRLSLNAWFALSFAASVCAQEASAPATQQPVKIGEPQSDGASLGGDSERAALHIQSTLVYQYHPSFPSPYEGPNSLASTAQGKETWDLTLYGGVRLWRGAELWINPEIDQGFGLSNTLGVAGFPSGEAYKVGSSQPYGRVHRAFMRQTIDLDGDVTKLDADLNQLAGSQSSNRLVVTGGKFSVIDIFDANAYAHDPRNDFLNWSIIDSAAFDYAANAWGYTYGVASEWYRSSDVWRLGIFDLSTVPNSTELDPHLFRQFEIVAEVEKDFEIRHHAGVLRVLGFAMHGQMGAYDEATAIAQTTGQPADIAAVRSFHTKFGVALNLQQQVAADIGLFARMSAAQGKYEAFEFTDVNRSVALGLSINGSRWQRADDRFGLGAAFNHASS